MVADQAPFIVNDQHTEEWCATFNKRPKETILQYEEERKKQEEWVTWHTCMQKENTSVEFYKKGRIYFTLNWEGPGHSLRKTDFSIMEDTTAGI